MTEVEQSGPKAEASPARAAEDTPVSNGAATWLAAAVPVAAGLLGLAGLGSSQAVRIAQLYPLWYTVLLLLVMSGVVVGAVGLAASGRIGKLTSVGLVAFSLGVGGLVGFNALIVSSQNRPVVAPSLTRTATGTSLTVSVAADNLKGDEYVFLLVQGYNSQRHLIPWGAGFDTAQTSPIPPGEYSKQRVFNSRIGPRPDGSAEATFEILVNEQWYEQLFVEAALITGQTPEERRQAERASWEVFSGADRIPCETLESVTCATLVLPGPTPAPSPAATT